MAAPQMSQDAEGKKKRKDLYYLTKLLWVRKPAWLCPLALHHDVGMWQSSEGLLNQIHFQYGSHDWKSQVSFGRRSFPQHSLGVLKSDSQFLPVGHPKRAERKPQCLLTWDLRLLSIDIFTMPIGCQLGPMYCGIAL